MKTITPKYSESILLSLIEPYFDEWFDDRDWWYGDDTIDIHVMLDDDSETLWSIEVFCLETLTGGYAQTDTFECLDFITFELGQPIDYNTIEQEVTE